MEINGILNIDTRLRNIISRHYRRIDWRERGAITTRPRYKYIVDIPRSGTPTPYRVSLFLAIASNGDRFVPAISRDRRRLTPAAAKRSARDRSWSRSPIFSANAILRTFHSQFLYSGNRLRIIVAEIAEKSSVRDIRFNAKKSVTTDCRRSAWWMWSNISMVIVREHMISTALPFGYQILSKNGDVRFSADEAERFCRHVS